MTRTSLRRIAGGPAPLAATAVLATVLLAGCGAGSGAVSASAAGSTAPPSRPGGFARARFAGGVNGPIASVGSGSFTVHPPSGRARTVDWTSSTAFARTGSGSLADVTAGSCVAVTEASGSDASTGSVDADSVRISPPVTGACAGPGTGGARPPQAGGSGSGSGGYRGGFGGSGANRQGGGPAGRGFLVGTVHSVSSSSFLVDVTASGASASGGVTTTVVDVSGSTTYTVSTPATSADLAVGECARVFSGLRPGAASSSGAARSGTAAPTGPVTAASVMLSKPVNGSCAAGFPRRPHRSGGPASSGSTGANA